MPGCNYISGHLDDFFIKKIRCYRFNCNTHLIVLIGILFSTSLLATQNDTAQYDANEAVAISQAAIGNRLDDLSFINTREETVKLSDYHGKPLLVSLVFTSCHLTCPIITKQLELAVSAAREALGDDSFHVVTIGFDPPGDTPQKMKIFATQQNINIDGWDFLSTSQDVIDTLTQQLGFTYFSSPRGFDHITQVSIIDRNGLVYQQVYGDVFELPWLVEPLKELVFNRPSTERHLLSDLIARVKIFCTVYTPNTGRYRIDYSLFIQILVGFIVVVSVAIYLYRESKQIGNR